MHHEKSPPPRDIFKRQGYHHLQSSQASNEMGFHIWRNTLPSTNRHSSQHGSMHHSSQLQ